MRKPNQSNAEMLIRSFPALHCRKGLRQQVDEALLSTQGLNDCYIVDPSADLPTLGGMSLRGDVRLTMTGKRKSQRVHFFFRRGDRAIFDILAERLGYIGKPIMDTKVRVPSLVDMMGQDPDLGIIGKVIVSDAAIDAAMDCTFAETERIIEFSVGIHSLAGKIARGMVADHDDHLGSTESGIDPGPVRVVLHRGRKVRLDQRAILLGRRNDAHLIVHFTWLPRERAILIGWFSEVVTA